MPPAGAVAGAVVEIACDESGFSGTNLLRSTAPVITHASVDLRPDEAVTLITELRSGFRLSPHELKSGQFLRRPGAGATLDWLLTALAGRAHVHLVDKEFFLVTRVVDLFLTEPSYLSGTRLAPASRTAAEALYRAAADQHGPAAGDQHGQTAGHRPTGGHRHGPADPARDAFLSAFVDLVRNRKGRPPIPPTLDRFFQARDALPGHVFDDLDRDHVLAVLTRLHADDRSIPPPLEPLLPALAETVLTWSAGGRRVLVTHDEQSALTADRLTRLQQALAGPDGISPLAGLVMADSRDDPRIQVADLLAGVARRSPEIIDDTGRNQSSTISSQ